MCAIFFKMFESQDPLPAPNKIFMEEYSFIHLIHNAPLAFLRYELTHSPIRGKMISSTFSVGGEAVIIKFCWTFWILCQTFNLTEGLCQTFGKSCQTCPAYLIFTAPQNPMQQLFMDCIEELDTNASGYRPCRYRLLQIFLSTLCTGS